MSYGRRDATEITRPRTWSSCWPTCWPWCRPGLACIGCNGTFPCRSSRPASRRATFGNVCWHGCGTWAPSVGTFVPVRSASSTFIMPCDRSMSSFFDGTIMPMMAGNVFSRTRILGRTFSSGCCGFVSLGRVSFDQSWRPMPRMGVPCPWSVSCTSTAPWCPSRLPRTQESFSIKGMACS